MKSISHKEKGIHASGLLIVYFVLDLIHLMTLRQKLTYKMPFAILFSERETGR